MNYIKHLTGFFDKVMRDERLNPTHISLYVSLFQFWNVQRFKNPISISRDEVMRVSKICSKATYHKCMRDLHNFSYLHYDPSFNPFRGSLVTLFNLELTLEQVQKKNRNLKNLPVNEQVLNGQQTGGEQDLVPSINNTNILNNSNVVNESDHTKKNNSNEGNENSENDSSKFGGEKKEKLREKKKVESAKADEIPSDSLGKKSSAKKEKVSGEGPARPLFEEVQNYFIEKRIPALEAEKFYFHYESNGWLVGNVPMRNWQAAAEKWIRNADKFSWKTKVPAPGKLHTSNDKNYGEPL